MCNYKMLCLDIEKSSTVGFEPELIKFNDVINVNDNSGTNKILILRDSKENIKVFDALKDKFKDIGIAMGNAPEEVRL